MKHIWTYVAMFICLLASVTFAAGPYSVLSQEPSSLHAYPTSLWWKPLPIDIMSHLATNSDLIASTMVDSSDGSTQPESNWGRFLAVTPGRNDTAAPHYYGQASDPTYTITSCGFV